MYVFFLTIFNEDPISGSSGSFAAEMLLSFNVVILLAHTGGEKNGQATEQAL
jgi:hypothetical protein